MQIKIISGKGKWYEKYIGRKYQVKGTYEVKNGKRYVIRNYRTILRSIAFKDAEIVNN